MKGSGTTHKGLRRIQKQPIPKSTNQTAMNTPTAQPGAISPEAKKKGANASSAARVKPATTYLATVRASRGMAESSHASPCAAHVIADERPDAVVDYALQLFGAAPELEEGYSVMWEPEIGLSREETHVTSLPSVLLVSEEPFGE
jgi:hypothetical protein